MENQDPQKLSMAITKALAYTENGGKPSVEGEKAGKTGEVKSIFQFEPTTWKEYSKQVTGQDNLPVTPANESVVALGKVSQWVKKFQDEGKNPQQIATAIGSLWNSGNPNPNVAGKGVNKKYNVKYDTPGYAKKVADYTDQFLNDSDMPDVSGHQNSNVATNEQASAPGLLSNPTVETKPNKQVPLSMQQLIANQSGQSQGNPGLAQKNINA